VAKPGETVRRGNFNLEGWRDQGCSGFKKRRSMVGVGGGLGGWGWGVEHPTGEKKRRQEMSLPKGVDEKIKHWHILRVLKAKSQE